MSDGHFPEDILAQGSDREPRFTFPEWRPSRAAGIVAVVALVAGLGIGYSVGKQQGGHGAAAPAASASSATPTAPATPAAKLPAPGPGHPHSVIELIAGMGLDRHR